MVALIPKHDNDSVGSWWKNIFHKFSPESRKGQNPNKLVVLALIMHEIEAVLENWVIKNIYWFGGIFILPNKAFDPLDCLFVPFFVGPVRWKVVSFPDNYTPRVPNRLDFFWIMLWNKNEVSARTSRSMTKCTLLGVDLRVRYPC